MGKPFNWRQSNTKHIYNRNMKLLLILVALFAGSQAAPQYGPVGGQQGDGTAPLQQRAPAAPARTKFRTEYEDYTETECTTEHKEDCEYHWEGQGEAKVWVPIPGTCKSNPYNTCVDVKKQRERQ